MSEGLLWPPSGRGGPLIMAPPALANWAKKAGCFAGLGDDIVFATSGSSGKPPKGVVFHPEALIASAQSVNQWLGSVQGGDWCCPLPVWHVGGFMIHIRASLAGTRVYTLENGWNPGRFVRILSEKRCSWTSLVPAQVVDIVSSGLECPPFLKCAIVGGGALDPATGILARKRGWPVVQSYGMTEAASQIATARLDEPYTGRDLPVLPHWMLSVSEEGFLQLKGPARFRGYLSEGIGGKWQMERIEDQDWWTSRDVVELKEGRITFLRRGDRMVKILGELVDIDDLEVRFAALLPGASLCSVPSGRRGQKVYACHPDGKKMQKAVEKWNLAVSGLHKIEDAIICEIPHNDMGKIDRAALQNYCNRLKMRDRDD